MAGSISGVCFNIWKRVLSYALLARHSPAYNYCAGVLVFTRARLLPKCIKKRSGIRIRPHNDISCSKSDAHFSVTRDL